MDLLRGEPQARQFILRSDLLFGLLEAVAAQAAVEDDRGIQAITHISDVALQRRPGNTQTLLQIRARRKGAGAENLVDLVDPFHAAHKDEVRRRCLRLRARKMSLQGCIMARKHSLGQSSGAKLVA
jgi:hypothetical protein